MQNNNSDQVGLREVDLIIYPFEKSFSRSLMKHVLMPNFKYAKRHLLFVTPYDIDDDMVDLAKFAQEKYSAEMTFISFNEFDNIDDMRTGVQSLRNTYKVINMHYHFGLIKVNKLDFEQEIRSRLWSMVKLHEPFDETDVKQTDKAIAMLYSLLTFIGAKQVYQYIIDPIEPELNKLFMFYAPLTKYFVHQLDGRPDVHVNPYIVYPFHSNDLYNMDKQEREFDFVFGLTAFDNPYRKNIVKTFLNAGIDKQYNFYYCYRETINSKLIDNRIPYTEYLKQIAKSKTTLTIPAYDESTFSVHRFIEALALGCISLVDKNAAYKAGFNHNKDVINFIEIHLLVNTDEQASIKERIEYVTSNYYSLLKSLTELDAIQQLFNEDTYSAIYQAML